MTTATEEDSTPDALLEVARHAADVFASVFGDPDAIAAKLRLATRDWLDLAHWLAAIEQLARCILFLLAIPLARQPAHQEMNGKERTGQGQGEALGETGRPAELRAHFRYWRTRRSRPDIILDPADFASLDWRWQTQPRSTLAESHDAAPAARRFAAVLRVLTDPERHAKRLASMLPRIAKLVAFPEPRETRRRDPCATATQRARERLRAAWAGYCPPDPPKNELIDSS